MLEGVLHLGMERGLEEELGGDECSDGRREIRFGHVHDSPQHRVRQLTAHDRRRLQHRLGALRQPVDPCRENGLDRSGYLGGLHSLHQPVGAGLAGEHTHLCQRAHALLEEERIALRAIDQSGLYRRQRCVNPEETLEE